ncbi:glutamine--fructose-6-phosphate transaminase (isomerizing) [Methanosphaerula palustris]|uniref:Glutamine--fructose-6-phosphate aminotransferase [isomerizing] n=1 Tax=Methanosphaerula palustris (strain ATCC BAA-1556 / DSM 19958 / E1-9c) TaxID=521011 RepID=B8GJP0_METPE|nr:glutamine--fructose-6-phosphate transaminase (isomerizing) [Methanosphaerula palustris]ACL15694.1 glucosamine/fructose-6-phosphate aminotransferase, isomerizing [Methanosphaerula palustris E1-9c]
MCGIVGYIGFRRAAPVVVNGLKKLEYRGYDSFGIAVNNPKMQVFKKEGRISKNEKAASRLPGHIAIGHTRWATHGIPNDINAHPHQDCTKKIAVVHNGIIENYAELKRQLIGRGHTFISETDTEVIAHLIEEAYKGDLQAAVYQAIQYLQGSYALLVTVEGEDKIVAARDSSPLVLGVGDGEFFAASDVTPLLEFTERVIYLEDGDLATLTPEKSEIFHNGVPVERSIELIDWSIENVKKGGFEHYMLKEIYEQPQVFYNTMMGITPDQIPPELKQSDEVTVVACGSSYHTGLIFKYLLESICRIPVRAELGSEFKYFTPPIKGLVMVITQSGETADTLAALKKAKAYNCPTLAITNVLGSTVTRMADHTLFMRAGPEISVAATKSFIAQLAVLMQIANLLHDGDLTGVLTHANSVIEEALLTDTKKAVEICSPAEHIFYVGRGLFYPIALEGALKMKEISYIHAEGYAAGELKHGPFALLSPQTPVVALCSPGNTYPVMVSNIKEMKARGAPIIAIGVNGDLELSEIVDVFIPIPESHELVQVLATSVVLQMLAYHTAVALNRDIDKPRNLAKSVTVE